MSGLRLFCYAVLYWLLASCGGAWAGAAYGVSHEPQVLEVSEFLTLYDPAGLMSVADVSDRADAGGMTPATGARTPFTLKNPDQAVWLRFDVKADATAPREWQLEVGRAVLDKVQLFTRTANGPWQASAVVGAAVPFHARPVDHRHFVFPVSLARGEPVTMLLRVQYAGPSAINVRLWQPAALQSAQVDVVALFSLYFGLAGGMLIYVLLLSLVVRERGYLLYAGSVGSTALGFATHSGLGAQFIWGDWPWWNCHGMFFGYGLAAVFSVALTRQFLRTRERLPRTDAVLRAVTWMILAGVVMSALLPANVPGLLFSVMAVAVPPVLLVLGFVAVKRHWPGARYFLGAWTALHLGVLVLQARHYGLVPDNAITANSIAIGAALEMILLSLALADLINDERRKNAALNMQLQERVADRTRELRSTQDELVGTARRAGMVEVANNVLHNVGNTLNSVNVAAQLLASSVAGSRMTRLARAVELADANGPDLITFLRDDPRGRAMPAYIRELAAELEREHKALLAELAQLTANVDHIKNVVATQQASVGSAMHTEWASPADLMEAALRIVEAGGTHQVEVVKEAADMAPVELDKTRVLQILVNLVANACQAMDQTPAGQRTLRVAAARSGSVLRFTVRDNGRGIDPQNMGSIFEHGFTTRPDGHGFGLHASARAAREMGGTLTAKSDGTGLGATFTLELPVGE